jgi:hypothetical protein
VSSSVNRVLEPRQLWLLVGTERRCCNLHEVCKTIELQVQDSRCRSILFSVGISRSRGPLGLPSANPGRWHPYPCCLAGLASLWPARECARGQSRNGSKLYHSNKIPGLSSSDGLWASIEMQELPGGLDGRGHRLLRFLVSARSHHSSQGCNDHVG